MASTDLEKTAEDVSRKNARLDTGICQSHGNLSKQNICNDSGFRPCAIESLGEVLMHTAAGELPMAKSGTNSPFADYLSLISASIRSPATLLIDPTLFSRRPSTPYATPLDRLNHGEYLSALFHEKEIEPPGISTMSIQLPLSPHRRSVGNTSEWFHQSALRPSPGTCSECRNSAPARVPDRQGPTRHP